MSSPCPCCCHAIGTAAARRGPGLFGTMFKLMLLYLALVWGGGILMSTGNPLAMEIGQLLHVITLVDPAIAWSDAQGWDHVANGMRLLANGAPFHHAAWPT